MIITKNNLKEGDEFIVKSSGVMLTVWDEDIKQRKNVNLKIGDEIIYSGSEEVNGHIKLIFTCGAFKGEFWPTLRGSIVENIVEPKVKTEEAMKSSSSMKMKR